jgi:hypothetical protein
LPNGIVLGCAGCGGIGFSFGKGGVKKQEAPGPRAQELASTEVGLAYMRRRREVVGRIGTTLHRRPPLVNQALAV